MDVDDIEADLLRQFNCMGTTDKEELVKQFRSMLGGDLTSAMAHFYLDMSNWNLQAAICSYFDLQNNMRLPEMKLLSNPIAADVINVEPGTDFVKSWIVHNSGSEPWPENCRVVCAQGDRMGARPVEIPPLASGHEITLQVSMTSPSPPGIHQAIWRLCTPAGLFFGEPLWVIITVVVDNTLAITQQLSSLNELGTVRIAANPTNPFQINGRDGRYHCHQDEGSQQRDHGMC